MRIVIIVTAILLSTTAVAASRVNPVNEKVRKTFNTVFSNAVNTVWSVSGNYFIAYFVNDAVKTRALFNGKVRLVQIHPLFHRERSAFSYSTKSKANLPRQRDSRRF